MNKFIEVKTNHGNVLVNIRYIHTVHSIMEHSATIYFPAIVDDEYCRINVNESYDSIKQKIEIAQQEIIK